MIEKITDQNLERYDSRLKEWCDRKFFEKGNYGKYQTTEEAGAVAFYPAPNIPLEGKVKFSFKEIMPAEGTKGPDNPSTIIGMSNVKVTRCGKNLCPIDKFSIGFSTGLTASANTTDGYISISGTAATTSASVISIYMRYVSENNNILVSNGLLRGETYTFSLFGNAPSSVALKVFVKATATAPWANYVNVTSGHSQTYTIPETVYEAILRLDITSGSTVDCNCYVQVEKGSTATSFEPYEGNNYAINLDNTYYGGEIDLATGLMTVNRVICELDGTEWWTSSNNDMPSAYNPTTGYGWSYCILRNKTGYEPTLVKNSIQDPSIISCTHFTNTNYGIGDGSINDGSVNYSAIFLAGAQCRFSFPYSTVTAWKNYLAAQKTAGTPVKVVYLINDPYTVQLTQTEILSLSQFNKYTPRLNTVYTDADSVQISYLKSPIRDEYEKTQAILSLGG